MTTILNVHEEEVIPVWQATWALVRYRPSVFVANVLSQGYFWPRALCLACCCSVSLTR